MRSERAVQNPHHLGSLVSALCVFSGRRMTARLMIVLTCYRRAGSSKAFSSPSVPIFLLTVSRTWVFDQHHRFTEGLEGYWVHGTSKTFTDSIQRSTSFSFFYRYLVLCFKHLNGSARLLALRVLASSSRNGQQDNEIGRQGLSEPSH